MSSVLGIDASSSVVGYSILNEDLSLEDVGYVKLKNGMSLIEKSLVIREKFCNIKENYSIDFVGIEDILTKFIAGKSSIKTIITLSQFNILTQFHLYEVFNIIPHKLNVLRARNLCGIKIPKGYNSKEFVLKEVQEWYSDIEWPEKRTGGLKNECFDMADSLVVSKAMVMESRVNGSS